MVSDLGREMFLRNFPPIIFLKGFNFWHILEISYRNFRSFTRTADYLHRPIIAYGEKKSQQITRTGG